MLHDSNENALEIQMTYDPEVKAGDVVVVSGDTLFGHGLIKFFGRTISQDVVELDLDALHVDDQDQSEWCLIYFFELFAPQ